MQYGEDIAGSLSIKTRSSADKWLRTSSAAGLALSPSALSAAAAAAAKPLLRMTNRSFKAKLIGSEILRSIKERNDYKTDVDANNPDLTKEKNRIVDQLQTRLVAVLEKEGSEKDALVDSGSRPKEQSSAQVRSCKLTDSFCYLTSVNAESSRHRGDICCNE